MWCIIQVKMFRLLLCVLAMVSSGLAAVVHQPYRDIEVDLVAERRLLNLLFNVHEPLQLAENIQIATTWNLRANIGRYSNSTAVRMSAEIIENNWMLPRGHPFSVLQSNHVFQATTFFNLLNSATNLETFLQTAVYLRHHINEYMFVYILSIAVVHRSDTHGLILPPVYEIFPSFFNNGEVMTTARTITTHNTYSTEQYPSTFMWDTNVVIRSNFTSWPYYSREMPIAYFTHDFGLNNYYYSFHLMYPFWLGTENVPLSRDSRGEWFWFTHRQIMARYYMERLSNCLGEVPELGTDFVEPGYTSGLLWYSGVPYPARPNYFYLQQPSFVEDFNQIVIYEQRIRDAIDAGYIVSPSGERVDIREPESFDVFGRLVEANVDSPNRQYYGDFIGIWRSLLGNSNEPFYWRGVPWVLPSTLEQYQTSLRDPAFYMIWNRVLNLFRLWRQRLPSYTPEELSFPGVSISSVDVDRLVTYFQYDYINVTNLMHLSETENNGMLNNMSVVVQHTRLNHKPFGVRLNVHSESPRNVIIRFFLAPRYDSQHREIPLHENTENFFQFDQFYNQLNQGDNTIVRESAESQYFSADLTSGYDLYHRVQGALENHGQVHYDINQRMERFPQRLLLPKGRVGGMPFVVMVYINEYPTSNVPVPPGFNYADFTSDPLGYPLDRPLYDWQVRGLRNMWFEDVMIHHKQTPEIYVVHNE